MNYELYLDLTVNGACNEYNIYTDFTLYHLCHLYHLYHLYHGNWMRNHHIAEFLRLRLRAERMTTSRNISRAYLTLNTQHTTLLSTLHTPQIRLDLIAKHRHAVIQHLPLHTTSYGARDISPLSAAHHPSLNLAPATICPLKPIPTLRTTVTKFPRETYRSKDLQTNHQMATPNHLRLTSNRRRLQHRQPVLRLVANPNSPDLFSRSLRRARLQNQLPPTPATGQLYCCCARPKRRALVRSVEA